MAAKTGYVGWPRAVVTGLVIVAASVGLLMYAPDLFLTQLTGLSRSGRVAIASVWFFVALGLLAWVLRRLQAHREI
jgi:hypothetical protein